MRINEGSETIEIEFTVGPINVADGNGREVIARYASDIQSKDLFWSDSNGREMMKRQRNYRPTWTLDNKEPVASNYVPVTTAISIKDDNAALTVLTDRSQGGTSLRSGEVELMVHRRTLHDDDLGVAEPLNEPGLDGRGLIISGTHTLVIASANRASRLRRQNQEMIAHPLALLFAPVPSSKFERRAYSAFTRTLPINVQMITLESISADEVILRLGHMFAVDEDDTLSKDVEVNLQDLLGDFSIDSIQELNLSANQLKSTMKTWQWNTKETPVFS